jgi:two-component system LytT family response regulator
MRVIIIDDEKLARENIKAVLKRMSFDIEIVGEANSVNTGIEILSKTNTDLVFMDIDLNDGSGFNILESLPEIRFQTIFITAYSEFAVRALRADALDYLLKPINTVELKEALCKARNVSTERLNKKIGVIPEKFIGDVEPKRLLIHEIDGIRFINISDILRCSSDNNYTKIYLTNGDMITACHTLKKYSDILEKYNFFRIHRSHLVNIRMIKKILKRNGLFAIMNNDDQIQISRRRMEELRYKME